MSRSQELFTLENCSIVHSTEAATLIEFDGEEYWIPLSHTEKIVHSKTEGGDSITMTVWIAKQKGLL